MLKTVGGIVAGLAAAMVVIMAMEFLGHSIYPGPAEAAVGSAEGVPHSGAPIPLAASMFVVLAWFAGAAAGAAVAVRIAARNWAAWVIGGSIALAGLANVLMMLHPVWMQIAAVVVPVVGALVGGHLASRGRRTDARA